MAYKQAEDFNVQTVRSTMPLKDGDVKLYYKYLEPLFDDIWNDKVDSHKLTTECRIVRAVDPDNAVMYESSDSGFLSRKIRRKRNSGESMKPSCHQVDLLSDHHCFS